MLESIKKGLEAFLVKRPKKDTLVQQGVLHLAFSLPLSDVEMVDGIPKPVKEMVEWMTDHNNGRLLREEGLFRQPGNGDDVQKIKRLYDTGHTPSFHDYSVHTVAGALKLYLREMPEPLFTFSMYSKLIRVSKESDDHNEEVMIQEIADLVLGLPPLHTPLASFLLKFLLHVSQYSSTNKMSADNLAMVFAPNVLRPAQETLMQIMEDSTHIKQVLKLLIEQCDRIFPDKNNPFQRHRRQTMDGTTLQGLAPAPVTASCHTPQTPRSIQPKFSYMVDLSAALSPRFKPANRGGGMSDPSLAATINRGRGGGGSGSGSGSGSRNSITTAPVGGRGGPVLPSKTLKPGRSMTGSRIEERDGSPTPAPVPRAIPPSMSLPVVVRRPPKTFTPGMAVSLGCQPGAPPAAFPKLRPPPSSSLKVPVKPQPPGPRRPAGRSSPDVPYSMAGSHSAGHSPPDPGQAFPSATPPPHGPPPAPASPGFAQSSRPVPPPKRPSPCVPHHNPGGFTPPRASPCTTEDTGHNHYGTNFS